MKERGYVFFPLEWIVPFGILILWQVLSGIGILPYHILPSPVRVVIGFVEILQIGVPPGYTLPRHILESSARVLIGFLLATVLGVSWGMVMGWSRILWQLVRVPIEMIRPVPPLAWVPIAILWFGIGIKSAVFIIFLGAFFPILFNSVLGVVSVSKVFIEASIILGAGKRDIFFRILTPGAMPSVLTGLRIGLGIAWMTVVAAEFTGVKTGYGLGYMIMTARDIQRPDQIIAGMIVIGLLGYLMDWFLRCIERKILRWV
jgi:NitT/TauT family transport system permease protein